MLDDLEKIKSFDKLNILGNIADFPDQLTSAWELADKFAIPAHYYNIKNIVLCGMGGSAIAGFLTKELADQKTRVPIFLCNNYNLSGFVDNNTLVIAVSYSGNTEETISALVQAHDCQAKILAISTGGELSTLAKKLRFPFVEFNYGSPPRSAWGYPFGIITQIFKRLGIIEIDQKKIISASKYLTNLSKKINPIAPSQQNIAKSYAEQMKGKIPIIVGAQHLGVIAYRWSTQINENAKQSSWHDVLPEMNHNRIEGFVFPPTIRENLHYYILSSQNYHERIQLRENLLGEFLENSSISYEMVYLQPSTDPFTESLSFSLLGDYISFYLSILNSTDPSDIKNIEKLKDKLANTD